MKSSTLPAVKDTHMTALPHVDFVEVKLQEQPIMELNVRCWGHARRKFSDAMNVVPKEQRSKSNAYLVMKQIQAIYREAGKLKDLSPEERLMHRQLVIKPLVDALFVYLKIWNRHFLLVENCTKLTHIS